MQVNFLGAHAPLTKRFHVDGSKDDYPMVKNFTSYSENVTTIDELYDKIIHHAGKGHCMLKGDIARAINNEPRAGLTKTDNKTQFICLDFDRLEAASVDDALKLLGLNDIAYVVQYSSSHGLEEHMGTVSAHVFMLLDEPVPAPRLKSWLMALNLDKLEDELTLSASGIYLSWPLDITTCQNDKLIYIAPPLFDDKSMNPFPKVTDRIKLVSRKRNQTLNVAEQIGERNINILKKAEREKLNKMRDNAGLPKRTALTKWVKGTEVFSKPDVCEVTDVKDCGEFIRININGGDSWAYWHHKNDFEMIHDFKSSMSFITKEFVPTYYKTLIEEKKIEALTPSEDGDLVLGFSETRNGDYYRGIWNASTESLKLYRARDRTQVFDWYMNYGLTPPESIPTWEIAYDPHNDWIVDEETQRINTFRASPYMLLEPAPNITPEKDFPNIYHIVRHFLGEQGKDTKLSDHFLNWFAVLFQRKDKPTVAWVNHGVQGTGKGFFMLRVVRPLFGEDNVVEVGLSNIEDQFNGWQERKLFINVNEINADDFTSKGRVESKFKMWITDKWIPVRHMRQTMVQSPNYGSYLFSSNENRPVIIAMDDRRYNVGNRQNQKLVPPKEEDVAKELEAFAQWLLAHKADVKLASEIIQTDARTAIQKLGVNSFQETCNSIVNGEFDIFWMNMLDDEYLQRTTYNEDERSYNMLIKDIGKRILEEGVKQTLSRDEIGLILQRNVGGVSREPNKLTSRLRQNGVETKQIRHKGKKAYGIHVTWRVSDDIRKEIEETLSARPKLRRAK